MGGGVGWEGMNRPNDNRPSNHLYSRLGFPPFFVASERGQINYVLNSVSSTF